MTKQEKLELRNKLVDLAIRLGYTVELDSPMSDHVQEAVNKKGMDGVFDEDGKMIEECRPAGDCHYKKQRVRVREGKSVTGQVCTLFHELTHALGLGGDSWYTYLGEGYVELVCESVTAFMAACVGIDRTKQTAGRILNYGYGGYIHTPLTAAICNVFCDELGYSRFTLPEIYFELKKVESE